jgi:flagellar basal body-associated protein FliL
MLLKMIKKFVFILNLIFNKFVSFFKKLAEAENLVDNNTAKIHVQSKRLKHNAYNVSNCWIYLMLLIVMMTFISLTVFMRTFRKRTITIIHSNIGSKSSLSNNSINQTTSNTTNVTTTTKSTDYISLLLNYANDNHTDL